MQTIQDEHYQKEHGRRLSLTFLHRAIRWQLMIVFVLSIAQCVQIAWIQSQCRSVYGLSVSGRVLNAYSFSCPIRGVDPLYDSAPQAAQVGK